MLKNSLSVPKNWRSAIPSAPREVPPLVLAILRATYEATKDSPPPSYLSVSVLRIEADHERIEAAVLLGALCGWLRMAGVPPNLVALTEEGIDVATEAEKPVL
jgi:hypothetical protein